MKKLSMEIINVRAAGIDVGSRFHMVAVNQSNDDVKQFGVYTEDHQQMISYLKCHGITTIAMESTGSYWQTLFSALQAAGFEVLLVNGQQTRNIKGKKTDVQDCVWIQKLHSLGLLSGSFLPGQYSEQLRTYYNHRLYLVEQTSRYINKMQKALRLMNIRLDVVLNDITGKSGRAIIEAIIAGQRDPQSLASLTNVRVKKSKEEIAKSLEGNWREDLLFEVKECLSLYDVYEAKIIQCDKQLNQVLESIGQQDQDIEPTSSKARCKKQRTKHSPAFDVSALSHQHFKVDLFAIPGLSYNTGLCLLTSLRREDLKKFPTAKHFTSCILLAPNNKITGGKIISSRTPKGKNKIALAFRQVANSIGNMKKHPLLPFFRRVAYKKGRAAAITATARKVATIFYHMVMKQREYQLDTEVFNEKIKIQKMRNIKKQLEKLSPSPKELESLFQTLSISTACL
jgi:transposase